MSKSRTMPSRSGVKDWLIFNHSYFDQFAGRLEGESCMPVGVERTRWAKGQIEHRGIFGLCLNLSCHISTASVTLYL